MLRHIPALSIDYPTLKQRLEEAYPQLPFSVEDVHDSKGHIVEFIVRASDTDDGFNAKLGDLFAYSSSGPWRAQVTEILPGEDLPLRVRRGNHIRLAYASPSTQALIAAGKITVGQQVLVMFVDGDRTMPVVI